MVEEVGSVTVKPLGLSYAAQIGDDIRGAKMNEKPPDLNSGSVSVTPAAATAVASTVGQRYGLLRTSPRIGMRMLKLRLLVSVTHTGADERSRSLSPLPKVIYLNGCATKL